MKEVNMKKIVSLFLAIAMCLTLCMPALAISPDADASLPPWVDEGETWVPAGDVMLLEDFGTCPKGHGAPAGYKYEGYTTGKSSSNYDGLARVFRIISALTGKEVIVSVGSILTSEALDWLAEQEDPNVTYFKYVYTKAGAAPYIHIIYTFDDGDFFEYISCETYYQI